jgi:Fe-S-cluster containining protein
VGRQTKLRVNDAAVVEKALTEVRAVYHDVAGRPMDRDCRLRAGCCHFRLTGKTPHLTRGEALVLARGLRASGRTRAVERSDGACPLLGPDARCLVYEARPFGCRTHFCLAAGGPADRSSVLDLIRRLEAVDEAVGGDGPKPLPQALHEALAMLNRRR